MDETRGEDTVARVGGDEFVLLFPGLTNPARIQSIAQRMIARLEEPIPYRDETCRISASIGMVDSTLYPRPEAKQMLDHADIALYASKEGGRARATFFDPSMVGQDDGAATRDDDIRSDHKPP